MTEIMAAVDSFEAALTKCTGESRLPIRVIFKNADNERIILGCFRDLQEMRATVDSIRESGKIIEAKSCYLENNSYTFVVEQKRSSGEKSETEK